MCVTASVLSKETGGSYSICTWGGGQVGDTASLPGVGQVGNTAQLISPSYYHHSLVCELFGTFYPCT